MKCFSKRKFLPDGMPSLVGKLLIRSMKHGDWQFHYKSYGAEFSYGGHCSDITLCYCPGIIDAPEMALKNNVNNRILTQSDRYLIVKASYKYLVPRWRQHEDREKEYLKKCFIKKINDEFQRR